MNPSDSTPESTYTIDLTKRYPRLNSVPIVEAAIEIRCAVEEPWTEDRIRPLIEDDLEGYRFKDSASEYKQILLEDGQPVSYPAEKVGFKGIRFCSDDEKYVWAFNRDALVVSRLEPYETWALFRDEALKVWELHSNLARPSEIERIGLRFINRIPLPEGKIDLDDFLEAGPRQPRDFDFPIADFLHRDSFRVPGYPYRVNIVRTLQRPSDPEARDCAIIIDIDVYSQETIAPDISTIKKKLEDMRILKNDAFFGSITPSLHDDLQGDI